MEKKFDIFAFDEKMTEKQANQMNAVVLAFVGDAVHSLYVRNHFSLTHSALSGSLHQNSTKIVKAASQCKALDYIFDELTESEKGIATRARNSKTNNIAKNSNLAEYKKSTAFEAVLGFLFLTGQKERLIYLLDKTFEFLGGNEL